MNRVRLSSNKIAIVDSKSFDYLNQWKWSYSRIGYAHRKTGPRKNQKMIYMHRLIMKPKKGQFVDHKNGNKLDNRRNNLRICTKSDNVRNSKILRKNNTSGYKGVYWRKDKQKWSAAITFNYKTIHLGLFRFRIQAAIAYNRAAIKYFGKYAKTNTI